jgi:hypothetical protein
VNAPSEPQFRSLDLPAKHVTRAWMAATVSAGLTLIFGALAAAGVIAAPGFDAWSANRCCHTGGTRLLRLGAQPSLCATVACLQHRQRDLSRARRDSALLAFARCSSIFIFAARYSFSRTPQPSGATASQYLIDYYSESRWFRDAMRPS